MLTVCGVRISLRFQSGGSLSPWMGAVFRGGFGAVLRALACRVDRGECSDCPLVRTCAYGYVFETPVPRSAAGTTYYTNAPHPFIFKPSLIESVGRGDRVELDLLLVGKAMEYLPYFLISVKELGRRGLGSNRARFDLMGCRCLATNDRVDENSGVGPELAFAIDPDDAIGPSPGRDGRLRIAFKTPLRLKSGGKPIGRFEFHPFVSAIVRRTRDLAWWHCGQDLRGKYDNLLQPSGPVRIVQENTRTIRMDRLSRRQYREIPVGGLIGDVILEGDLAPFQGLFNVAAHVGVGNKTSFGLGQVEFS